MCRAAHTYKERMLLDDLSRLFSRDYSSRDLEGVKKKKKRAVDEEGLKRHVNTAQSKVMGH